METEIRYVGIDPSGHTGVVIVSATGHVIHQAEIKPNSKEDPQRMCEIVDILASLLLPTDVVAIEGFGYHSQQAIFMGGIGWAIRMMLHRKGISYQELSPSALKQFAGAPGNGSKEQAAVSIYKTWGFEHPNNNVLDAYVLARFAQRDRAITLNNKKKSKVKAS